MLMLPTRAMHARELFAAAAFVAAAACGQIGSTPTAPTDLPARSASVPSGTARGPAPAPTPAPMPTPTPSPAPSPAPAPAPPPSSATGRVDVTINPNPVPFSGQPITDIASCRDRPNTWFYEQVLREVGGVAVTVTERVDAFDGAVTSLSNPSLRIPANGSTTLRTRWCSSSPASHTAQTNFSGTDANGRTWSVSGPTVRLLAR